MGQSTKITCTLRRLHKFLPTHTAHIATNLADGDGLLPAAMPSLTDLVRVIPPDREEDPEDIFASAPGLIFTDDLRNIHGDPESIVVYTSKRFGPIELCTADPEGERERRLFSHYVWNASIKLAELVSAESEWRVDGETVLELGAGVCEVMLLESPS